MIGALLSKLPASRPADWKCWNMSVGIAVLCEEGRKIVCVSDERASFGAFSGDNMAWKAHPISYDWNALYAGDDAEYADAIIRLARSNILKAAATKKRGRLPPEELVGIFDESYADQLQANIENKNSAKA